MDLKECLILSSQTVEQTVTITRANTHAGPRVLSHTHTQLIIDRDECCFPSDRCDSNLIKSNGIILQADKRKQSQDKTHRNGQMLKWDDFPKNSFADQF